jgi:hypothetical protein
VLRHIVLFTVKEENRDELDSLIEDLRTLQQRVPQVRRAICGPAIGGTGYDAALVVELDDRAALPAYREHPEHLPSLQRLRAIAHRVDVADIETPD